MGISACRLMEGEAKQYRLFQESMMQYIIPCLIAELIILVLVINIVIKHKMNMRDTLTGLPNREVFLRYTENLYHSSNKIFIIAFDNFKVINETCGTDVGDILLQWLAEDFQAEFPNDRVYRYDGDIFALIVGNRKNIYYQEKINRVIARERILSDMTIQLQACVCQLFTMRYDDSGVIQMIEFMIDEGKKRGKGTYLEINDALKKGLHRKSMIEQTLMEHLNANHFEVHYQPIWDVKAGKFHSMEALVRLNVPGYGYISPEEFILIAERNGMVLKLGMIVLEEVCKLIKSRRLQDYGIDFVEINLSVIQCMQTELYTQVIEVLNRYEIPPEMINLEITESAQAFSEKQMAQNIARLTLKNITFSLDDYGSGYSNINYLTDFPFTIVKIDKYLVWEAMKKVSSKYILESTIAMCKKINKKVVTEGIENEEMLAMVKDMGADYVQGYYFSKPVPGEKLIRVLEVNTGGA